MKNVKRWVRFDLKDPDVCVQLKPLIDFRAKCDADEQSERLRSAVQIAKASQIDTAQTSAPLPHDQNPLML